MESNPESGGTPRRRGAKLRLPLKITTISWWDLAHALGPILLASAAAIWLAGAGSFLLVVAVSWLALKFYDEPLRTRLKRALT